MSCVFLQRELEIQIGDRHVIAITTAHARTQAFKPEDAARGSMPSVSWSVRRHNGVTLVEVLVQNDGAITRVRVHNRLDGAVWPPRRRGVPEEGWRDDGFEGVLGADETLALGYATPGQPKTPPVSVSYGRTHAESSAESDRGQRMESSDQAGRTHVRRLDSNIPGEVIVVVGSHAGAGASTVAYNLGAQLDAVVVDAGADLAGTRRGPDLQDVIAGRAAPIEAVREDGPVAILPCWRPLALRWFSTETIRAIQAVADEYGRVIVDSVIVGRRERPSSRSSDR